MRKSELRRVIDDEIAAVEDCMASLQWEARDFWLHPEASALSVWTQLPVVEDTKPKLDGTPGEQEVYFQLRQYVRPALRSREYGFGTVPTLYPHLRHYAGAPFGTRYLAVVMGAEVTFPRDLPEEERTGWFAWVDPIVHTESDVDALEQVDVSRSPAVKAVIEAYDDMAEIVQGRIPFVLYCHPASFDLAADLLGHLQFYEMLASNPGLVGRLIDVLTDKYIDLLKLYEKAAQGRWANHYYEPGLRMGEMITRFVSPDHVREFLLPVYQRVSRECSGIFIDIRHPDPSLLDDYLRVPGLKGISVPKEWPSEPVLAAMNGRMPLKMSFSWHYHEGKKPYSPVCYPWGQCRERFAEFAGKLRIHADVYGWGDDYEEQMSCVVGDFAELRQIWAAKS